MKKNSRLRVDKNSRLRALRVSLSAIVALAALQGPFMAQQGHAAQATLEAQARVTSQKAQTRITTSEKAHSGRAPQTCKASQARVASQRRAASLPSVLSDSLSAKSLGGAALPLRVLLPAEYEISARRYPVLYLLHGATGGENDWLTRTNLTAYAARYHLIIVMPGVGDSWYANSASDAAARYEDAIVRDLIPYVDGKYHTIASAYGRAIAGLSMGGFGAMKFALRYPHLFAFAASFSGAFDAPRTNIIGSASDPRSQILLRVFGPQESETRRQNDLFQILSGLSATARLPYLYVSTGENDPLSSVMPANPRFAEALRERKIAYEYHERPGTHDWRFWDAEIKLALERMNDFVAHMQDR